MKSESWVVGGTPWGDLPLPESEPLEDVVTNPRDRAAIGILIGLVMGFFVYLESDSAVLGGGIAFMSVILGFVEARYGIVSRGAEASVVSLSVESDFVPGGRFRFTYLAEGGARIREAEAYLHVRLQESDPSGGPGWLQWEAIPEDAITRTEDGDLRIQHEFRISASLAAHLYVAEEWVLVLRGIRGRSGRWQTMFERPKPSAQ